MSELSTRTLSALVLGTLALALTYWSYTSFLLLCLVGYVLLLLEWWQLTRHRGWWWMIIGFVYLSLGLVALIFLRGWQEYLVFLLFAIVWGGDTAAYLIGRRFGKHKIAPRISPGKSWEGLAASIVASAAIAYGFTYATAPTTRFDAAPILLLGALLAVVGLLGDLFESSLKRHAEVKDSGHLIPGHGGLFDRVDALLPCAIVMCLYLLFLASYYLLQ
jgi:phosphatidate cytidylyltransferase